MIFKQIYLTNKEDLTGTISPIHRRPACNGNESGIPQSPKFPELEPHYQMQLSVIP